MSLDTILDDMASVLQTKLPELTRASLFGGRMDIEEMRRHSKGLPAAFVACTATRDGSMQYGKFACRGLFVVIIAVRSRPEGQAVPQDRAHNIVRLLSRALKAVASAKNWGNAEVTSVPAKVASTNPYSTKADENGLALWAITWEQDLELIGDPAPAELPDLTEIHADWKMAESTQPEDAEDDIDTDGP